MYIYLKPANEVWGKVIFLHLFVILFTEGGSVSVHDGIPPHPPGPAARPGTPPDQAVADPGGAEGAMAPPSPVEISHKKDGCQRRPHRFHVSWPPPTQPLDLMLPGTPPTRHLPSAEHAGRYGQCAGGTHPTGMQSYLLINVENTIIIC